MADILYDKIKCGANWYLRNIKIVSMYGLKAHIVAIIHIFAAPLTDKHAI